MVLVEVGEMLRPGSLAKIKTELNHNLVMNGIKTVFIKVSGIDWDLSDDEEIIDAELPTDIDELLIEVDESVDPYEKYTSEGFMSGFEVLAEEVVEELSTIYGFCLNGIDDIEILRVE